MRKPREIQREMNGASASPRLARVCAVRVRRGIGPGVGGGRANIWRAAPERREFCCTGAAGAVDVEAVSDHAPTGLLAAAERAHRQHPALAVRCPTCGEATGEPCRDGGLRAVAGGHGGRGPAILPRPHRARLALYEAPGLALPCPECRGVTGHRADCAAVLGAAGAQERARRAESARQLRLRHRVAAGEEVYSCGLCGAAAHNRCTCPEAPR